MSPTAASWHVQVSRGKSSSHMHPPHVHGLCMTPHGPRMDPAWTPNHDEDPDLPAANAVGQLQCRQHTRPAVSTPPLHAQHVHPLRQQAGVRVVKQMKELRRPEVQQPNKPVVQWARMKKCGAKPLSSRGRECCLGATTGVMPAKPEGELREVPEQGQRRPRFVG